MTRRGSISARYLMASWWARSRSSHSTRRLFSSSRWPWRRIGAAREWVPNCWLTPRRGGQAAAFSEWCSSPHWGLGLLRALRLSGCRRAFRREHGSPYQNDEAAQALGGEDDEPRSRRQGTRLQLAHRRRRQGLPQGTEGQDRGALFLSARRHAGLHSGSWRLPRLPA